MFSPVGQTNGSSFYYFQNEAKIRVIEVIEKLCQTLIDEKTKEAFLLLFDLVKANFAVLNQNGNSPHMPEIMQIIFVLLIICEKEGSEYAIYPEDIYNLLDKLELHLVGKDKAAIAVYRQNDGGSLVTRGIEFCRAKTGKNIVFVASGNFSTGQQNAPDSFVAEGFDLCEVNQGTATAEFLSIPELYLHLNSFLPFKDGLHLSQTCVSLNGHFWSSTLRQLSEEEKRKTEGMDDQDKFLKYPEFRGKYVAEDKCGLAYVNSIGITSKLLVQKIRNGELSIEAAQAKMKVQKEYLSNFDAALEDPNLTIDNRINLHKVANYIVNGILTIDRAMELSNLQAFILSKNAIQLLVGHHLISIERAINLSEKESLVLCNSIIYRLIINGLIKIDQVFDACNGKRNWLTKKIYNIEKYTFDSPTFLSCVINLPLYAIKNLISAEIEKNINDGLLTIDKAIALSEAAGDFLSHPGVQLCIKENLLTVDQAINLADDMRFSSFLDHIKYYSYLDFRERNRVNNIGYSARWDLVAKAIQLCTADSSLTPTKIAQYYIAEKWDLLEEAIR